MYLFYFVLMPESGNSSVELTKRMLYLQERFQETNAKQKSTVIRINWLNL